MARYLRSMGLELTGVRNDRTSLAVLDFFPESQRLVLSALESQFGRKKKSDPDQALVETLLFKTRGCAHFTGLAVHGPTSLPPSFGPLPTKDSAAQLKWLHRVWSELKKKPPPFLPYMQRPAEIYLRHLSPEKFQISDALGANAAPITARICYLAPKLPGPLLEVYPKATLSRVVSSLGLPKSIVRDYLDLNRGLSTRENFFNLLCKKIPQLFLYERDTENLILNISAFYSFLSALNQHLYFMGQCEKPPRHFPSGATWIALPSLPIDWERALSSKVKNP